MLPHDVSPLLRGPQNPVLLPMQEAKTVGSVAGGGDGWLRHPTPCAAPRARWLGHGRSWPLLCNGLGGKQASGPVVVRLRLTTNRVNGLLTDSVALRMDRKRLLMQVAHLDRAIQEMGQAVQESAAELELLRREALAFGPAPVEAPRLEDGAGAGCLWRVDVRCALVGGLAARQVRLLPPRAGWGG